MKNTKFTVFAVIVFIICFALASRVVIGFAGMLFSVTFIGGFILWQFTTFRKPIDPQKIIIPYLVTVLFFIVHVYEEYLAHVEVEMSALSGFTVSQHDFFTIAAFLSPVIWLLGLLLTLKHWQFGYFLVSTFLFGMMIGELSHFFSPFFNGGYHYSAGLYTAIFPISGGWYTFGIIRKERSKRI